MTRIGVVRHKVSDFSDWRRKFDERMDIRKSNAWAGHEQYYDEARKEAYVVHTVKDDKMEKAKQNMESFKDLGKRNEMKPSGNPDHSIMPMGTKIEELTY
ncbi:Uncharacterised protein [uncultured archaeon]|nr:Uncharacterised protein [uncultured archaeon]